MKCLYLLLAFLFLPLTGCTTNTALLDASISPSTQSTRGMELQSILQDFFPTEDAPLTISLQERNSGRISSYQLGDSAGRVKYLLLQGKWDSGNENLPESQYTIIISNGSGERFEVPSHGNGVTYSTGINQAEYTYRLEELSANGLYSELRFIFDGQEASPKNVSVTVGDGPSTTSERWVAAYQSYLKSTIPGGANEMEDIKLCSVSVDSDSESTLILTFSLAIKLANDRGLVWKAGDGYSGKGDLVGYIIVSRVITLEQANERWYCTLIHGS